MDSGPDHTVRPSPTPEQALDWSTILPSVTANDMDALADVVGFQKFGTPGADKKSAMSAVLIANFRARSCAGSPHERAPDGR